jgi:hypothetical protein
LIFIGERGGNRTRDLLIKSQMLYRLSYALPKRDRLRVAPEGGGVNRGANHQDHIGLIVSLPSYDGL